MIRAGLLLSLSAICLSFAGCISSSYRLVARDIAHGGKSRYRVAIASHSDLVQKSSNRLNAATAKKLEAAIHKEGVEHTLLMSGGDELTAMPIEVSWTRGDREKGPPNVSSALWFFTLGLFPIFSSDTATYTVTVYGPEVKRVSTFTIIRDSWQGWLPLFLPYPSINPDFRNSNDFFSPGDLVERGVVRETLAIASGLDYDSWAEARAKEAAAAEEAKKHAARMEQIAISKDRNWLKSVSKSESSGQYDAEEADAAVARLDDLLSDEVDALDDVEKLEAIAKDAEHPKASAKAEQKATDIRMVQISKSTDKEWLKRMSGAGDNDVRNAAVARLDDLLSDEVDALDDVEKLEEIAKDAEHPVASQKAGRKATGIRKVQISKSTDREWLQRMSGASDNDVRDAARERLAALELEFVTTSSDIDFLMKQVSNDDDRRICRDGKAKERLLSIIAETCDEGLLDEIIDKSDSQSSSYGYRDYYKAIANAARARLADVTSDVEKLKRLEDWFGGYSEEGTKIKKRIAELRAEALSKSDDLDKLERIALERYGEDELVKKAAAERWCALMLGKVENTSDQAVLLDMACRSGELRRDIRVAAFHRLSDVESVAKAIDTLIAEPLPKNADSSPSDGFVKALEGKSGIRGKTRLALMLEARAKIESLGVDSKTVEKMFSVWEDEKRDSLFNAIETIQPKDLRNEVAEQLLGLNIKQNDGRLCINLSDYWSRFLGFVSPAYAKKLFDALPDKFSDFDVIKSLLDKMDRKDAKAIFDDTRKRTAAGKQKIKFGGFYPGMSEKDLIVTSVFLGLDSPPYYTTDHIDGVGHVRFLVFPRSLRYKLLEAEDLDFWEIFLNKCVPLEKGQSEYKYYENEDSGKYLYKSIKQRTIVTYDHHSGQLRIGTFGGD